MGFGMMVVVVASTPCEPTQQQIVAAFVTDVMVPVAPARQMAKQVNQILLMEAQQCRYDEHPQAQFCVTETQQHNGSPEYPEIVPMQCQLEWIREQALGCLEIYFIGIDREIPAHERMP